MCLAVPARVIEVSDGMAVVESFGQRRAVSLLLMNEEVSVGDYLRVHVGNFAFEKVDPETSREIIALFASGDALPA